jgi:hypothetical protein
MTGWRGESVWESVGRVCVPLKGDDTIPAGLSAEAARSLPSVRDRTPTEAKA